MSFQHSTFYTITFIALKMYNVFRLHFRSDRKYSNFSTLTLISKILDKKNNLKYYTSSEIKYNRFSKKKNVNTNTRFSNNWLKWYWPQLRFFLFPFSVKFFLLSFKNDSTENQIDFGLKLVLVVHMFFMFYSSLEYSLYWNTWCCVFDLVF